MGQPLERDDAHIRSLEFDERNIDHLARHELTRRLVRRVWLNDSLTFRNPAGPGRSGTHLLIGPDDNGRVWTVVIVEADNTISRWRPITG